MELSNVKFAFLLANSTAVTQPLDAGIIHSFKRHYMRLFMTHALQAYENGASNIYKINILQAMMFCEKAWKEVSESTIQNCWRVTRLVAVGPKCAHVQQEIARAVETQITDLLDRLNISTSEFESDDHEIIHEVKIEREIANIPQRIQKKIDQYFIVL